MLLPQNFPFDVIARGTLALAGQVFVLAAYYQELATIDSGRLILRVSLSGALNLIFAVASVARAELQPAGQQAGLFYLLTLLGAVSTIWLASADRVGASPWRSRFSVGQVVTVYALQAWTLDAYGLAMASQWLMCWTYLAVAYFFLGLPVRGKK